jgi:hypothetical protein
VICEIIKVEVSVTLTETLIIFAKTEFNNCFIIHLFVLNRYRLLIIAGSFADNSVICYQITEFSVGCVIARFNCKLLATQIAFTNYNV